MKKKIIILIIMILVIGLALGVYWWISNNTNSKTETNEKMVLVNEEVDKKVSDLTTITKFLEYRSISDGNNIFDSSGLRLAYIDFLLMQSNNELSYITYKEYESKYQDIYGTNYNLEDDSSEANGIDFNRCQDSNNETLKNGNYVCWNANWGVSENKITLEIVDKDYQNDIYTLSGTYIKTSSDEEEYGSFDIRYTIDNNKEYLLSVIMNTIE